MEHTKNNAKVILTGTVGSHSYGTATADSDYDYMSLVTAPAEVYLGLSSWGASGTHKDVFDDAVKGTVEHQYFEIKKAMGLFSNFNPNLVPLLWLPDHCYEYVSPEGQILLQNRAVFNSKKAFYTFSHYAQGQLQKMGGVFNDEEEPNKLLKKGLEKFFNYAEGEISVQRLIRDARESTCKHDEGYLNAMIALRNHAKEEIKRIKDGPITGRMGKKRKDLREKFGYDVKFAFHTIRLMKTCNEFLKHPEGGLNVCRTGIDAEELYSIREGKYTQEEIKEWANDLFAEGREAFANTSLPDEPDYAGIEKLTMQIVRASLV